MGYENDSEYESGGDEFYDGEEFPEGEELSEDEILQKIQNRKTMMIIGAIGATVALHVVLIMVALAIKFYYTKQKDKLVVLAKQEFKEQDYDEKLKRALHKRPEMKHDIIIEKPIRKLEEEIEEAKDIPKGTSLSNLSNKNLESTSVVDAFGVGGGAAGAYGLRWGKGSLTREGGSMGTESAVEAALRWLKFHQSRDGSWDTDGFDVNCKKNKCSGPDFSDPTGRGPGHGFSHYDVGASALALLAYLGNGQTHQYGKYRDTVRKGLNYLKGQQQPDGNIGYTNSHGESLYNHALATMALCEAYAVSRDFKLKRPAEKAVKFCLDNQNPGYGWRYPDKGGTMPAGKNDTSVTGWMVLALKAAKVAKLDVPDSAWEGARKWFDRATSPDGQAGYMNPGDGGSYLPKQEGKYVPVPCMTAVAIICRIFTGQKKNDDDIQKGVKHLMDNLPTWDKKDGKSLINMYYWYYGTYAMFQVGGSKWKKWNASMNKALLETQRTGNDEDGSWDPIGDWGLGGGRVYATAINALTLEIYYRYERAQK